MVLILREVREMRDIRRDQRIRRIIGFPPEKNL